MTKAQQHDYQPNYADAEARLRKQTSTHNADIDAVIDALGLREAYPNATVTERGPVYPSSAPFGQYASVTRTTWGRDKFLADVRLAADAVRGADAAERVAAALKGKK